MYTTRLQLSWCSRLRGGPSAQLSYLRLSALNLTPNQSLCSSQTPRTRCIQYNIVTVPVATDSCYITVSSSSSEEITIPPQWQSYGQWDAPDSFIVLRVETIRIPDANGCEPPRSANDCMQRGVSVLYIRCQWRNLIPYLCQLVFAAILCVKLLELFVTLMSFKCALSVCGWSRGHAFKLTG